MKKIPITIAGHLGSGKSTSAKNVASMLGYAHYSSGDYARELARNNNLSIGEMAHKARMDASVPYDDLIDSWVREKKHTEGFVMDSRLAFHWIPNSFKVFLRLDENVAAKRLYDDALKNNERSKSELYESVASAKEFIKKRYETDNEQYMKKYGVDYTDLGQFDLVIDTGLPENSVEMVPEIIVKEYNAFLAKQV